MRRKPFGRDRVPRARSAPQHGAAPRAEDVPRADAVAGVSRALEGAARPPRRAHRARDPRRDRRRRERGTGGGAAEGAARPERTVGNCDVRHRWPPRRSASGARLNQIVRESFEHSQRDMSAAEGAAIRLKHPRPKIGLHLPFVERFIIRLRCGPPHRDARERINFIRDVGTRYDPSGCWSSAAIIPNANPGFARAPTTCRRSSADSSRSQYTCHRRTDVVRAHELQSLERPRRRREFDMTPNRRPGEPASHLLCGQADAPRVVLRQVPRHDRRADHRVARTISSHRVRSPSDISPSDSSRARRRSSLASIPFWRSIRQRRRPRARGTGSDLRGFRPPWNWHTCWICRYRARLRSCALVGDRDWRGRCEGRPTLSRHALLAVARSGDGHWAGPRRVCREF